MRKLFFLIVIVLAFIGCSPKTFTNEVLNDKLITLERDSISVKEILNKNPDKDKFVQIFASYCQYSQNSFKEVLQFQKEHPEKEYIFLSVDHSYYDWKRGLEYVKPKGSFYFISEKDKGLLGQFLKIESIPRFLKITKEGNIKVFNTSKVSKKLK